MSALQKPFSDAVWAGDTLYISGQIGLDERRIVPKGLEDEAHLLMRNLQRVLTANSLAFESIVSVTIFTPDVAHFEAFNAVYLHYFTGRLPARAFIGSGPLLFGARFELTAIAVKPPNSQH
ncbi:MAG: RidA family protein [Candidatus Baltobacteraceae bacterium]